MRNIRIIIIILLLVALSMLGLIGRCFYLQYYKTKSYEQLSNRAQETVIIDKPCRGVIMDCRGRVLAASNRMETMFADRNAIDDIEGTALMLAPIINKNPDEIAELIRTNRNPGDIKLVIGVDPKLRNSLLSLKPRLKGVGLINDFKRHYPAGPLASHIVGFVDANNQGQAGVELKYNKRLQGTQGSHVFYLDAARRPVRLKSENSFVQDGNGLILTIDSTIQQFARSELMNQYKDFQAESAVAIVMDPYTGAVLAMVSLPDFEPNGIGRANRDTWRNRVLTDPYEPGSIFKPVVVAAAIDCGAINKNTIINCENGSYSGKGFGTIGEYNHHRYGMLTPGEIIKVSSNIGMAKIGQKMGKDKLYRGLRLFGFGQLTGVDLPGEGTGVLWPVKTWTGYSVTRIPYGQEVSVTALQVARAFCILANGGKPVRPFILKATVDGQGKIVEYKQPSLPTGQIIKPEVAKYIVQDAMVSVINGEHGTGKNAALERWQVFGKTGTANIARGSSKGFSEDDYVASFVGGAPAEKPAVVVLVSIRKPNRKLGKGYTGGTVAAPVVREILDKTLTYMEQKGLIEPSKIKPGSGHKAGAIESGGGF